MRYFGKTLDKVLYDSLTLCIITPGGLFFPCRLASANEINNVVTILIQEDMQDMCNGNRRIAPTQKCTHEIKNVFMMLILG